MRTAIKRSADGTSIQLVLEGQNNEEDEALRELYYAGQIIALGETSKEHAQLILGSQIPEAWRQ